VAQQCQLQQQLPALPVKELMACSPCSLMYLLVPSILLPHSIDR